jgi:hypothetical protein
VRARIVLAHDGVGCAHQQFAGPSIDNEGAERYRAICLHGSEGKLEDLPHALFIERGYARAFSSRWRHAVIYHAVAPATGQLALNFCMETIRRLSPKFDMLS